jgi:hypothetical protein
MRGNLQNTRRVIGVLAFVVIALALYSCATQTPHIGQFHDDGIYAVTARAIADGLGYRITSVPTAPVEVKYPILYPLLLSSIWRLTSAFPQNIVALKAVNIVTLIWFLSASTLLFWRLSSWRSIVPAGGFAIATGLNPLVIGASDTVLSDNLLAPLFVTSLLLHCSKDDNPGIGRVVACALVSGSALLTRQVGIALVAAGLIWAWKMGRRALVIYGCIVAGLIVATYGIVRGPFPAEPVLAYYLGYEADALGRQLSSPSLGGRVLLDNTTYALDGIAAFVMPTTFGGGGWFFTALGLAGVPASIRRGGMFATVAVIFYMAIVWTYPFNPIRYILPLVPLIFIAVFEGIRVCAAALQRWAGGGDGMVFILAAALPLALIVAPAVAWAGWNYLESQHSSARFWLVHPEYEWQGFVETFAWIKSNTGPTDVLATAYDPMYFLYTGRRGVRPWIHQPDTYFYPRSHPTPAVGDPGVIRASLDRLGVQYLVVDPLDGYAERAAVEQMFEALLQQYGNRATLVFSSADRRHHVYRIARPVSHA